MQTDRHHTAVRTQALDVRAAVIFAGDGNVRV